MNLPRALGLSRRRNLHLVRLWFDFDSTLIRLLDVFFDRYEGSKAWVEYIDIFYHVHWHQIRLFWGRDDSPQGGGPSFEYNKYRDSTLIPLWFDFLPPLNTDLEPQRPGDLMATGSIICLWTKTIYLYGPWSDHQGVGHRHTGSRFSADSTLIRLFQASFEPEIRSKKIFFVNKL